MNVSYQTRRDNAEIIANILNNCHMLFDLDVFEEGKIKLRVITDLGHFEYAEENIFRMQRFLKELRHFVKNKEDIDQLIEENSWE
ncbi:hypothetical protein [Siminovitchia sp. 179-K 8D1 HS]|uniref:hypothetical protein n=1 Tax=Siminovitchia sp. 179-K 8D1 HS TaxID=3142385 RepID=UPI0039A13941